MISAVLFDMDGILFDSEYFYMNMTIEFMRELGYSGKEEDLYPIIGTTTSVTYDMLYDALKGKVSRNKIVETGMQYFKAQPIPHRKYMFEDVPETLICLKNMGIKIACCSSSAVDVINRALEAMEINDYFDYVISSEQVAHGKPSPDVYLSACAHFGLRIDQCAVYEDSKIGIQAGKNAGMLTIAREDKRFGQDQSGADYIVKNAKEMLNVIVQEDLRCQK